MSPEHQRHVYSIAALFAADMNHTKLVNHCAFEMSRHFQCFLPSLLKLYKQTFLGPGAAEITSFPFKHCYNLTDTYMTAIALARGITSSVCGVTSFEILQLVIAVEYVELL